MKILQITDPHFVAQGKVLHGLDPRERLDLCIEDINAHHRDASYCFITGDLAHAGQVAAYENLKDCLSRLAVPQVLLVGNHDRRPEMLSVFPDTPVDANGFVQSVVKTDAGHCILLDTALRAPEKGQHWGEYCTQRADWLQARLDDAAGAPVYLFMHHPPFDIGIPSVDNIRLRDEHHLARVVRSARNIRHIFLGHVHRPVFGSWLGVPFSILRGTNHQVPFDFETVTPVPKCHEPPAYGVAFLNDDAVVVHSHDYLDKSALPLPANAQKVA